jgi:hypothetical protein
MRERPQEFRALDLDLADLDDVAARLQPEAPTLPAGQLHPWVWDASNPRGLNLGWQSL